MSQALPGARFPAPVSERASEPMSQALPGARLPAPVDDWYALPVLEGELIRLEPLTLDHADGYLAAGRDDEEVFRWLNTPGSTSGAPRTRADALADIESALAAAAERQRFAYAQIDVATGEFAGSTSFYDVN